MGVASLRVHPSSHQLLLVCLGRQKCTLSGKGDKTKMAALEKALKEGCPGGLHISVYLFILAKWNNNIVFLVKTVSQ